MIRRSAKLLVLYLAGLVLVAGWSLSHVLSGTVTHENAAGAIVFPLAWAFGFWPTVMPVLLALRLRRLHATLEAYGRRREAGVSNADQEQEIEDTFTLLAMGENGIPERFARPFVRRLLRSARGDAELG